MKRTEKEKLYNLYTKKKKRIRRERWREEKVDKKNPKIEKW